MKKIILTSLLLIFATIIYAQEAKNEMKSKEKKDEIRIKVKDGQDPDVYIDGEKYSVKIMELLDSDKIQTITVLKDEKAIKEYNAPNGVIIIETKKENESKITIEANDIRLNSKKVEMAFDGPKIIIDGVDSEQLELKELSPDDIHSITVVKGEEASKKYNSKNGVILVTTKKTHKKKNK